jgi:transcriptional regulator with XRE-family HTH domain
MEAHPVDIQVGKKLRLRRTILGRSQEEVGAAVGVTFQQIQKYERGLNRIGASRLYEFAKLLGVDVLYFYSGIEEPDSANPSQIVSLAEESSPFEYEAIIDNKEVLALVRAYYDIPTLQVRKKMLSLIKSLGASKDLETDTDDSAIKKDVKEPATLEA